jgi:hypothetical protein
MLLRLLRLVVAAVVLGSWGCAGSADNAANPAQGSTGSGTSSGAKAVPITLQLELLSETSLHVGFGERPMVQALLTDSSGAPVPDTLVSFALMGRAQDSSLASLDVSTDADGVATNTLIAGRMPSTFRLRVSAPGALDVFADVAVSNAGFGTLSVNVAYHGNRAVAQRVVFAQASTTCALAERMVGDPTVTLNDKNDSARFLALPAALPYAVSVMAESSDETVLAKGCVDGVIVDADTESTVDLSYTDEPLQPAGQFTLIAQLDSSAPAAVLVASLRDAAQTLVQSDVKKPLPDAEGVFLLDSLDGTLRSDSYAKLPGVTTLADALSAARTARGTAGMLEHSLQAALVANAQGPLAAVSRIVELSQKSLGMMRLTAALSLSSGKRPLAWQSMRIESLPTVDGAAPPSVDLTPWQDMTQVTASFQAKQDTLELTSLHQRAQFGSLAAQVLTKVVSADTMGQGGEIRALMGCSSLGDWLARQNLAQKAACDAACVQATCDRAVARITGAGQAALLTFDDTRGTLTLQGSFKLADLDGDLVPDQLSAAGFAGQWDAAAAGQADALSGPASATAVMMQP